MRFDELDLEEAVLDGLDAMNFLETTPVQELTIPVILEGKDIIACAQTGTGKTAAYVLPVINELSKGLHPANAINAIIMAHLLCPRFRRGRLRRNGRHCLGATKAGTGNGC